MLRLLAMREAPLDAIADYFIRHFALFCFSIFMLPPLRFAYIYDADYAAA